MFDKVFILSIVFCLFLCLAFSKIRPVYLFLSATFIFYFKDYISVQEMLEHSTNLSLVTLILLLVSSIAFEKISLLNFIFKKIFHQSYKITIFRLGFFSALSSAFLNNTAIVASSISSIMQNQDHSAKKLLLPLSYFAIIGGTITLIGTSTNLVINSLMRDFNLPALGFFDFSYVGLCLFFGAGFAVLVATKFLPSDKKNINKNDENYFLELDILDSSKLVGKTIQDAGFRHLKNLYLSEIIRNNKLINPIKPQFKIKKKDKLLFCGDIAYANELKKFHHAKLFADLDGLFKKNLKEIIIPQGSILIGNSLKKINFRSRFDAAVVAIKRDNKKIISKIAELELEAGDRLVLAIGDDFLKRKELKRDFLFLSDINLPQTISTFKEYFVLGGFFLAIFLSAINLVSLFSSLSIYIASLIKLKILSTQEIRRRFAFDLWLIIASALCIADVFTKSNLANDIAFSLLDIFNIKSAVLALILVYLLTLITTELITNNAAAVLFFPIAYSISVNLEVSYMPFIMAVVYGASASFLSPYGYQTNLMIFKAGEYKFIDFIKTGSTVSIVYSFIVILAILYFFPF